MKDQTATINSTPQSKSVHLDAVLHSITWAAKHICLFDLRPERGQHFPAVQAGAHVDIHLANGLIRSYSIVNSQDEGDRYLIAVKNEVTGRGGSRFIHTELRVGQHLRIGAPRNNFRLCEDASHSVFIAGGIGITPLYSMIQRLQKLGRSWELHYAAANREYAAFVEQLAKLGSGVHFYFGSDEPNAGVLNIRETIDASNSDSDFYCCGPAGMLADFEAATASIPSSRVHVEYFNARDEPAIEGGFEVVLQRSGERFTVDSGETILDALIKRGVDVPYSCMEGVCGSCQVGVIEGTPDHRDLILSKEEREANDRMLICCSGSKSAKLVLDL
ncbi:2Fe-2S iron-sulfur cluster-binding protein [Burkholderia sp. 22PA0099]|uniref:PDR/VanB family oxidoreductase n=1 Tax=Burkholderia sp. 22PA0099 TaxID=3237372 RepID=UPI0039C30260